MTKKPLPIGEDDFSSLIRNGYYYVDKTLFIKELLDKKGKVNLFTRPRRFGKTPNMSILRYFFENTGDARINEQNRELFSGLHIMESGEKYTADMGKYPVISISLKAAKQPDFSQAYFALMESISIEFKRHEAFLDKMRLNSEDKARYLRLSRMKAPREECNTSLFFLSSCLAQAYEKSAVILIDEYDVPLENAWLNGFYDEMAGFIRSLFESALKTNENLEFAVITGCLRITKESIFTGLNNLKMISILNNRYGEYFGFTQKEVDTMLRAYECESRTDVVKDWYDGYLFGETEVYNPWSVINFVDTATDNAEAMPKPYWSNTSSNDIVRKLVEDADASVKEELERLIDGGTIEKQVHEDITYDSIYDSQDNLWNFLFFTGYLKLEGMRLEAETQYITMGIPNLEVKYIYKNTIRSWFEREVVKKDMGNLIRAIEDGDTGRMETEISECLQETVSFYDYAENYYHGFLTGLLKAQKKYRVISNRESGLGRPDIVMKTPGVRGMAVVLEIKTVRKYADLELGSRRAAEQLRERKYAMELEKEGYGYIRQYGLCFYKKECMVMEVQ